MSYSISIGFIAALCCSTLYIRLLGETSETKMLGKTSSLWSIYFRCSSIMCQTAVSLRMCLLLMSRVVRCDWHAASIIIVTGVCLTLSRRSCRTDRVTCAEQLAWECGRRWKVRRRVTVEGQCWSRCSWKQPWTLANQIHEGLWDINLLKYQVLKIFWISPLKRSHRLKWF